MPHRNRTSQTKPAIAAPRLWLITGLVVAALVTAGRPAAQRERCFDDGSGGQICLGGRFLAFWEQQGAAAVFGAPITPALTQTTPDGAFTVQYFERARFELHPENRAPYDVLLGRIGAEAFAASPPRPAAAPTAGACQTVAGAPHQICGAFRLYWRSHGLRLDNLRPFAERESIALLGLPLTPPLAEVGADGRATLVQWFERARLDQRPDGSVVAAPLGRQIVQATPAPAQQPTSTPLTTIAPAAPAQVTPTFVPTATTIPTATPTTTPVRTPTPVVPTLTAAPPPPTAPPVFNVPPPAVPCNRNVPPPANGLQLWVTDPNDPDNTDQMTACARLIVGGQPARGASANLIRYYPEGTRSANPQSTAYDGVAAFIFYTGAGSPGRPSQIEAVTTYQGTPYRAILPLP